MEIAEVAGDRQLEGSSWVANATRAQRIPLPLDFRRLHAAGELVFELAPVLGRDPGGGDQRQARDAFRMLEEVEHRQQPTPGVAAQRELLQVMLRAQRLKVGDVLTPAKRGVARHGGLAAAALVVIKERAASPRGEEIVLRKEIVVTRPWPAMQHHNQRAVPDLPREQPHYNSTASASATSFTSACSRSPNPFGTSESMSSWPRIWSPRRISTTSSDFVNTLQAR